MKVKGNYLISTEQYDVSVEDYFRYGKTFGEFSADGRSYTVTDKNPPRQWLSVMGNEVFGSIMTNDGCGLMGYKSFYMRMIKYYSETDYMMRDCNGKRWINLEINGKQYDLYREPEDVKFTVEPGCCRYTGTVEGVGYEILIFVPREDPVECTRVRLWNLPEGCECKLITQQDWGYMERIPYLPPLTDIDVVINPEYVRLFSDKTTHFPSLYGFTVQKGMTAKLEKYTEPLKLSDQEYTYHRIITTKTLEPNAKGECTEYIVSGACEEGCDELAKKYLASGIVEDCFRAVQEKWEDIISRNWCELPDKNMQHFLNVWLKNQVYITSLFNRFDTMGYRDVLQDNWGGLYADVPLARKNLLIAATRMFQDGTCPRKYDMYSDWMNLEDFADSPLWMPILLSGYLKETGDFAVLDEMVGYYKTDEVTTLLEHVERSLNYLYNSRGADGLILMREGDWLDGLTGIDKLGEATSIWLTMAAYYAQNLMIPIYERIGKPEMAELYRQRSEEYKKLVNTVGWNGSWFSYAIIDGTEHIGAPWNPEGKIYLNTQTWALLTGIVDPDKIERMMLGVYTHLSSPYGPQLLAPPYVVAGDRYGRLQKQRPGTFANGAIYLHAASFKVFADVARGAYEEALDTFNRILPNHPDNPDCRRTSEPYCVGNVYYSPDNDCPGLNLYSWWTATPAWMIHGGFEELLGVWPDYDGLRIRPLDVKAWDSYQLIRTYRGTKYDIRFKRTGVSSITLDGKPVDGNIVKSENETALVEVTW